MEHSRQRLLITPLLALLAWSLLQAAPAQAANDTRSVVQTRTGQIVDNGSAANAHASSSVFVDGENFANSFVAPQLGKMGAAASNGFDGLAAESRSSFTDSFACFGPNPCVNGGVVPLSLNFRLDGTFTDFVRPHGDGTGEPELEISARYTIASLGSFQFNLEENQFDRNEGPLGAGSRIRAVFCHTANCANQVDLPVTITKFLDDNDNDAYRFSLDSSVVFFCPGCSAGFVDEMSLDVSVTGGGGLPAYVDATHTFAVTLTSLDPNQQFISTAGRTTAPQIAGVPEPSSLALYGLGLVCLAWGRRRLGGALDRAAHAAAHASA